MNNIKTREEWLENAINNFFKPHFKKYADWVNFPEKVRVSIGFPSKKATGKVRVLGQCWDIEVSTDRAYHIFISPLVNTISGDKGIMQILAHELIHACGIKGHGKDFKKVGIAIGLTGKMSCSIASDWLINLLEEEKTILLLGEYPHGGVNAIPIGIKIDKCRMKKCSCSICGYTVRIAQKWINKAIPVCPLCDDKMSIDV